MNLLDIVVVCISWLEFVIWNMLGLMSFLDVTWLNY